MSKFNILLPEFTAAVDERHMDLQRVPTLQRRMENIVRLIEAQGVVLRDVGQRPKHGCMEFTSDTPRCDQKIVAALKSDFFGTLRDGNGAVLFSRSPLQNKKNVPTPESHRPLVSDPEEIFPPIETGSSGD